MAKFKKNINKKESVIEVLRELTQSTGWEVVLGALDKDIDNLQSQLDDELDKTEQDLGKIKSIHIKKKAYEALKDLPAGLIEIITGAEEVPMELDPFE